MRSKTQRRLEDIEGRLSEFEELANKLEAVLDRIGDRFDSITQAVDECVTQDRLDVHEATLRAHVHEVLVKHEELRTAVARGIEDVERRENRIRTTVGRARKALRQAGITPDKLPAMSFSIAEDELRVMDPKSMAGNYATWNYKRMRLTRAATMSRRFVLDGWTRWWGSAPFTSASRLR